MGWDLRCYIYVHTYVHIYRAIFPKTKCLYKEASNREDIYISTDIGNSIDKHCILYNFAIFVCRILCNMIIVRKLNDWCDWF